MSRDLSELIDDYSLDTYGHTNWAYVSTLDDEQKSWSGKIEGEVKFFDEKENDVTEAKVTREDKIEMIFDYWEKGWYDMEVSEAVDELKGLHKGEAPLYQWHDDSIDGEYENALEFFKEQDMTPHIETDEEYAKRVAEIGKDKEQE